MPHALSDTAYATVRYSFTGQFLEAAAGFCRRAAEIEAGYGGQLSEELRSEHRGLVSAAIMQSAAALETEAHEVCAYGPGAHLGSNGTNHDAQRILAPLADFIDDQQTLRRYQVILQVLRLPPLDPGRAPYQAADLVVRLRNEITHYKSRWGEEMSRSKLLGAIEALRHTAPPFTDPNQNFFPHRCLGAACATWAVMSTMAFLDEIYKTLGVPSRFEPYRERLRVPR